MNQLDFQELKESQLLLDDLLQEVIKEEGTLAGGQKLRRGGEAVLGIKESRVSLGYPTDNLIRLTPKLFSELGLELNPIHRRQMKSQFDFYYMTLSFSLIPKRGATFNMVKCKLNFTSPETVIVQSIFPTRQWHTVLQWGSGLELGLDGNLNWVPHMNGTPLTENSEPSTVRLKSKNQYKGHIMVPNFSFEIGRCEIEATGEGNNFCYWHLESPDLQKTQTVQFVTLFKVPQGTKKIKLTAKTGAKVSMSWLTLRLDHLFSELSQRFKNLLSGDKAVGLTDAEEWELELPDK